MIIVIINEIPEKNKRLNKIALFFTFYQLEKVTKTLLNIILYNVVDRSLNKVVSRKYDMIVMRLKHSIILFICSQVLCLIATASGSMVPERVENQSLLDSISWDKYHNYTEIEELLLEINSTYPEIADVFSVGKSWQNKTIYCLRLTNESDNYPKPAILLVGYHHTREPITAELALYFSVQLATNYGKNETITRMLNKTELYIIVALNPDGFETVEQNDWQRKNSHPTDEDQDGLFDEDPPEDEDGDGKVEYLWDYHTGFVRWEGWDNDGDGVNGEDWIGGVDLNRNYGYQWNASTQSGSQNPEDEDYKGTAPFSEPETRALRDLVMQYDFRYAVSLHSGADVILYPWGYTTDPAPDHEKYQSLAVNMSALVNSSYQQSGEMYTTSGVWDDWMYGNQSVFAFTFEIFRNSSAWTYEPGPDPYTTWVGGVFEYFNPLTQHILANIQRWVPALFYLIETAIEEYLPGDVNHDYKVDIYDVVSLTSIYGSCVGDPDWNPKLDLRRDGRIDIFDVVIVTSNYGRSIKA